MPECAFINSMVCWSISKPICLDYTGSAACLCPKGSTSTCTVWPNVSSDRKAAAGTPGCSPQWGNRLWPGWASSAIRREHKSPHIYVAQVLSTLSNSKLHLQIALSSHVRPTLSSHMTNLSPMMPLIVDYLAGWWPVDGTTPSAQIALARVASTLPIITGVLFNALHKP